MAHTLIGTLQGNTITLDTVDMIGVQEDLDPGRRVRVALEPLDDTDLVLSAEQQAQLLRAWAESGPQGPIDDDGDV